MRPSIHGIIEPLRRCEKIHSLIPHSGNQGAKTRRRRTPLFCRADFATWRLSLRCSCFSKQFFHSLDSSATVASARNDASLVWQLACGLDFDEQAQDALLFGRDLVHLAVPPFAFPRLALGASGVPEFGVSAP